VIEPVVAPAGTVAATYCGVIVKLALVPLKATAVACSTPIPLIITVVPTPPLVGPKDEIVGDAVVVVVKLVVVGDVVVVTLVVVGWPALAADTLSPTNTPTVAATTIAETALHRIEKS
jgi:hypothetical protein